MSGLNGLNAKLLHALGLTPESAQIVVDEIQRLHGELDSTRNKLVQVEAQYGAAVAHQNKSIDSGVIIDAMRLEYAKALGEKRDLARENQMLRNEVRGLRQQIHGGTVATPVAVGNANGKQ